MHRIENMPDGAPKEPLLFSPLPVRLSSVLLPEARIIYNDTVPPELQDRFERELHAQKRMGGLIDEGILIPENDRESDLEHVARGCGMVTEYVDAHPVLTKTLNPTRVQLLFVVHDAGEIIVGDMPMHNRTPEQNRRKALEPIVAERRLLTHIPDPLKREKAIALYKSYVNNDEDDLDVQMARLIDKLQGMREVARVTSPLLENREIRDRMRLHLLDGSLPLAIRPTLRLMTKLPTEEEREAVASIFNHELDLIANLGHTEAVNEFRARQAA